MKTNKLGRSARQTQVLVGFVYARPVSLGCIVRQTHQVGTTAAVALPRLRDCRQAAARFLLYDETCPKLGRSWSSAPGSPTPFPQG